MGVRCRIQTASSQINSASFRLQPAEPGQEGGRQRGRGRSHLFTQTKHQMIFVALFSQKTFCIESKPPPKKHYGFLEHGAQSTNRVPESGVSRVTEKCAGIWIPGESKCLSTTAISVCQPNPPQVYRRIAGTSCIYYCCVSHKARRKPPRLDAYSVHSFNFCLRRLRDFTAPTIICRKLLVSSRGGLKYRCQISVDATVLSIVNLK